jgi:hypothetical protein
MGRGCRKSKLEIPERHPCSITDEGHFAYLFNKGIKAIVEDSLELRYLNKSLVLIGGGFYVSFP